MPYDVFISHSSIDKTVADAAVAVLERSRIRCWVAPRDIMPGADWGASIIQGIPGSRLMLVIFSSHANASDQVKREVERAVHQGIPTIQPRSSSPVESRCDDYCCTGRHQTAIPSLADRGNLWRRCCSRGRGLRGS